ncbi:TadE/TadG family type IV pilus assembly protein [Cohnella lupini]|uniref:TadE-like protein n=1 Tax=Cohnella lupini TaxID=1294267 RepID=A0A3D9INC9_9BACL|nr:TadE family protein [Cohnella lupini]RED63019.1 TadE-like protein [Cohnella lupini]
MNISENNSFRFIKNQKGSFTIEASLVFPLVFLVTILLIFMSLYVYQKSTLYYLADTTAKRASWVWDNTYRDGITGEFNPYEKDPGTQQQLQNDGLYWRFNDFNMMDVLTFQFKEAVDAKELSISASDRSAPSRSSSLVNYKLQRAVTTLPKGVSGSISYENKFYKRKITVHLENPLKMPDFVKSWFRQELVEAEASSFVTEPTEFIRTVDFAMYLGKKLSQPGAPAKSAVTSILTKTKK